MPAARAVARWPAALRVTGQSAAAMAAALAVGAALVLVAGANPLTGYLALIGGAFGSLNSLAEVGVKAAPLLLAGLGIAFAFKAGYWNIGAEGQLYMGALGATWIGLHLGAWPMAVVLPAAVGTGFVLGAIWGLIPGLLLARLGVSEIINTIMFNYIAIFFVSYLVTGPMKEEGGYLPQTDLIAESAVLPKLLPPTRLHAGVLLAVGAAAVLYWIMVRSTLGYRLRVVGGNPQAARYAGISVDRVFVIASGVSGGLAGLAGMGEISGLHQRLLEDISPGYGYTAIVVALLGRLHPVGVVIAAVLFSALRVGADAMQRRLGIPVALVYIIQALVILFVVGREAFERVFRRADVPAVAGESSVG